MSYEFQIIFRDSLEPSGAELQLCQLYTLPSTKADAKGDHVGKCTKVRPLIVNHRGGGGGRRRIKNHKISRFATDFHLKSSISETKLGKPRVKATFSESSVQNLFKT